MHANDFVGLDARVAASAEPEAVKAAISELPRLHGGAEVLDRVDALLTAAGIGMVVDQNASIAGAAGGCAMSSLMQGTLWLAARNNP